MPTRRKVTIPLYDGDDLAELQRLRTAADDAKRKEDGLTATLADTDAEEAREAYNEFLVVARDRADKVVLQALPRGQWRALVREHPPREIDDAHEVEDAVEETDTEGNTVTKPVTRMVVEKVPHPDDVQFGVNDETFPDALLPVSVVEPADFDVDDLSDPDFERLYMAAWMLNRQVADPKALPVSDPIPVSDET